jgi:hypothetical protein
MQGTSNHTNEASDGLQSTKAEPISLEPWDIAEKCLPIENGPPVSVEFATDAQFQAWVISQHIPVDEQGIAEWSFDDRCGVIMYALANGISLQFASEAATQAEDTSFLHRVELAKPLLQANPSMTSRELADALGLRSAVSAHELKVYIAAQEGA